MTPPPAAAAAAPSVRPRRPVAPRGPRRVSGPARPAQPARSRQRAVGSDALGVFSALESLAQHRLLDRLIRGRTWIAIVAFALIGIVTLQLGLLKLNGGIGRALEHEAVLQRQNATLSIENSELASGSRVESQAAHLGMSFVPAGALRFLTSSSRGDVGKAASALSTAPAAAGGRGLDGTGRSAEQRSRRIDVRLRSLHGGAVAVGRRRTAGRRRNVGCREQHNVQRIGVQHRIRHERNDRAGEQRI